MPEFSTLSCPSCGAKLQIGSDIDRFACDHCGNEHIVKRSGGIVSLAPVLEQLQGVHAGVNKTASELAIKRLKEELIVMKASMPSEVHGGCITRLFLPIIGLFLALGTSVALFWVLAMGALNEKSLPLIGGITVAIAAGVPFLISRSIQANRLKEKQKPFIDAIAQKEKEIAYHEKIVKI